ncbi:precorrin-3B C(17)-methyltransferase [Listeria ivanovii]|uniref:precorrin-3B C(17)-methyltransferase n=1 Tax=Listeria ivanovii TaxID=1638 RepID=UPI000DAA3518|nr:precorrin-3B C(17)-methyltransferase [Listeria ivanovii]PZF87652.1 precorrin-3B C(17)-methyltransferase [Listeria ivanovii]PZF92749.1 precorrin-3B C(17)-methyltransferase [Listeria ivanovii]PZG03733.1 precorrin-3B C(17)-methyltransferase [Listeria ivanovii]PZG08085.1 precorrin-3B C(17)-methyltransferase [Listeria ivanovii]PZG24973.1 precorrin-3B C(17)-methyltransferase [Listeria ivanovii]
MIYVIGIGPGDKRLMTGEALQAIEEADVIVGYVTYIKLIKELIKDKEIVKTGMRREIDRCQEAVNIALTGKNVAVVSSGDAGIYGMAGLVLELAEKSNPELEVKVVPGITASIGAAAVLGAPIMHDFCHISLSDLMTPWEVIEKRLLHAAMADFVVCFYHPRSKGRANHLANAFQKMMEFKSADTIVGIVKDVGRKEERKIITTMREMDYELVDMTTMVIVGNKETYVKNGKMITPRGYSL